MRFLSICNKDWMSAYKSCNSKEAVTYAEAELPDLVFMDLDLPDLDGVKTTAILKQNPKTSQIPVVAVTATYLIKPVSPQTPKRPSLVFSVRIGRVT
ncbi:MAG TPA: response regulator [Candidatus Bathyarchaeia archaeon]|nr:response regulator [Candidatus Bathyarchaeia archaeon]